MRAVATPLRCSLMAQCWLLVEMAGAGALNSAEIYNPYSRTWAATGAMSVTRESHTATSLDSGGVLIAGGTSGRGRAIKR